MEKTYKQVSDYYANLQSNKDLKTSVCCTKIQIPEHIQNALKLIDDELIQTYYGCGLPIPIHLTGLTVLDLGCGTGRDVFLLSKLVGEKGFVYGIDMTESQLNIAKQHIESHRQKFDFQQSNVKFIQGFIENLEEIKDNSIDLVVSNCVINLSPDKPQVFKEILRVLKPGGEMYISDIFSDRRIPSHLREDPILYGECISGALYIEDFRRILQKLGIQDYRKIDTKSVKIDNQDILNIIGKIKFYSITLRAFKIDLEDKCEDYGESVIYQGGIKESQQMFVLDDHHTFKIGEEYKVCGNTSDMLNKSRFKDFFVHLGNKNVHQGVFDCKNEQLEDVCCKQIGKC